MHEVDMMHKNQTLITFIHPASPLTKMVEGQWQRDYGLTLDGVPRISAPKQWTPSSMSTCAGYKGMLMAAIVSQIYANDWFSRWDD